MIQNSNPTQTKLNVNFDTSFLDLGEEDNLIAILKAEIDKTYEMLRKQEKRKLATHKRLVIQLEESKNRYNEAALEEYKRVKELFLISLEAKKTQSNLKQARNRLNENIKKINIEYQRREVQIKQNITNAKRIYDNEEKFKLMKQMLQKGCEINHIEGDKWIRNYGGQFDIVTLNNPEQQKKL